MPSGEARGLWERRGCGQAGLRGTLCGGGRAQASGATESQTLGIQGSMKFSETLTVACMLCLSILDAGNIGAGWQRVCCFGERSCSGLLGPPYWHKQSLGTPIFALLPESLAPFPSGLSRSLLGWLVLTMAAAALIDGLLVSACPLLGSQTRIGHLGHLGMSSVRKFLMWN